MKLKNGVIKQTINYKSLKPFPFNRNITYSRKLEKSMQTYGFLGTIIVIMTDLFSGQLEKIVMDGHRRMLVASSLKIPINYQVLDKKFNTINEVIDFCSTINNSGIPWNITDYINIYARAGFPEYKKLNEYIHKSTCTATTTAIILGGIKATSGGGGTNSDIKNGTFKIQEENHFKKVVHYLPVLNQVEKMSQRMILAFSYVVKDERFKFYAFLSKYKQKAKCIKDLRLNDYSQEFMNWL